MMKCKIKFSIKVIFIILILLVPIFLFGQNPKRHSSRPISFDGSYLVFINPSPSYSDMIKAKIRWLDQDIDANTIISSEFYNVIDLNSLPDSVSTLEPFYFIHPYNFWHSKRTSLRPGHKYFSGRNEEYLQDIFWNERHVNLLVLNFKYDSLYTISFGGQPRSQLVEWKNDPLNNDLDLITICKNDSKSNHLYISLKPVVWQTMELEEILLFQYFIQSSFSQQIVRDQDQYYSFESPLPALMSPDHPVYVPVNQIITTSVVVQNILNGWPGIIRKLLNDLSTKNLAPHYNQLNEELDILNPGIQGQLIFALNCGLLQGNITMFNALDPNKIDLSEFANKARTVLEQRQLRLIWFTDLKAGEIEMDKLENLFKVRVITEKQK